MSKETPHPDQQHSSQQRLEELLTAQQIEVLEKLEQFVQYLVSIFEAKLSEYCEQLEEGVTKPGKLADFMNTMLKTATAGTKLFGKPVETISNKAALFVAQKALAAIGSKINRDSTKLLAKYLYLYKSDSSQMKEQLIIAGIEVFQCYECQFTQVTANGVWQNAILKLAEDVVSRVYNHFKNSDEDEFTTTGITRAVIQGQSKKFEHKSTNIPHMKAGHTLTYRNMDESWNTAKLFDKTGLARLGINGTVDTYYKRKTSNTEKYGYRLLFKSELEDSSYLAKLLNIDYTETKRPREEYFYVLTENCVNYIATKLLEETMKNKDSKDIPSELLEQLKKEASDYFSEFESFVTDNFKELTSQLEESKEEIRKMFETIASQNERYHGEARQQREVIAQINSGEHLKTQKEIKDIKYEMKELVGTNIKDKGPVWFDVEAPVRSFVHRQGVLNEIIGKLKTGTVVITGLSGMGKSELAKKYAQDHSKDYCGNVIWINAKTQETIRDSFFRLNKERLKLNIKFEDGAEKPLDFIVKEVYDCFSHTKSLFVLDCADKFRSIEPFLPKVCPEIEKPDVLITSQNNSEWESDRMQIWPLPLHDFTDDEARQLVKNVLDIQGDSQNQEIEKLFEKLCNFPLALKQASLYIKEKQKYSKFSIAEFIVEFEKSPRNLQKDKYLETIYNTSKVTLGRITNSNSLLVFDVISYFESNQIPKKLLVSLAGGKLSDILSDFEKYLMAQVDGDMISVHGLVQKMCRLALKEEKKEFGTLTKALDLLNNKIKHMKSVVSLRPHVLSIWSHACMNDKLIDTYIVKDIVKKPPHIGFFHLLAGSSEFEVFKTIVEKIKGKFSELEKVICAEDGHGGMPVHYAASNKDTRVLRLLIGRGANVNVRKKVGLWTPLHLAVQNNYHKNIMALLVAKADVDARTDFQFTSLHLAARNGRSEIVEMLTISGADVNAGCKRMFTPLHFAAKMNNFEVVRQLLYHSEINVNAENDHKLTPLHFAAKAGYLECVEELLQKGANPNVMDKGNFTPLHLAVWNEHAKVVTALLGHCEIDANLQTSKGKTASHMAAEKGNLEIERALIEKLDIKNINNINASSLANVLKYLKSIQINNNRKCTII